MEELRRGSPKKRFLWRRLLPFGKEDDSSNDETTEAKKLTLSTKPSMISIPHLSEEKDSHPSKSIVSVTANRKNSEIHLPQDDSSYKIYPRPFLASFDSPLGNARTPQLTPKPIEKLEHKTREEEPRVENLDRESTRLVTAASVLLLMRFSVTEQALSSLTRGESDESKEEQIWKPKGKEETVSKESSGTNEEPDAKEEPVKAKAAPKKDEAAPQVDSTFPAVVSPETTKSCTTRVISAPSITTPACPKRLAMPEDPNELNSLHCFVRAHLLEVFALPSQKSKPARVGLRCVFCSHLPRKERSGATMCSFYPKSLNDLYRCVMTWQRIHFRICKHVCQEMKEEYWKHKESDQTRGKTTYWTISAMRLGLQDINDGRNGICFVGPLEQATTSS